MDNRGGSAKKRPLPRYDLVQDRAEGEQIRPRIQLFATSLFRRHVGYRAYCRAGTRQQFVCRNCRHRRKTGTLVAGGQFRQTEVENFRVSALCNEDVRRLDVSVNNALGMGCIERVRNLDS